MGSASNGPKPTDSNEAECDGVMCSSYDSVPPCARLTHTKKWIVPSNCWHKQAWIRGNRGAIATNTYQRSTWRGG
jgi:hypothetical protein